MRRSATSVFLVVGLLALTACGSSNTTQQAATTPSSTSVVQTTEPLTSDTSAPSPIQEVSAKIIGTQTSFSLTAALAESPVVFWFWAPGWGTCNREAPSVEEVSKKFSGKVRIVGVAWNGTDDSYLNFIDRHSLTFDNLDDTSAQIFSEYDIPSQPAWAFINQDGTVDTRMGVIPQDELVNLLEALS